MNRPARFIITSLLVLLPPASIGAAEPACVDCHPDKNEGAIVHPAVAMGCGSCHSGTHMGEKPAPKLMAAIPELCFTCHDQGGFQNPVQHAPVAGGMCLSCHTPHAGPIAKLLTAAVPDLCFTCHDEGAFQKQVQHPPAASGMCLSCHAPHSSSHAGLLTDGMNGTCTGCHDQQASGNHILKALGSRDRHPVQGRPDPAHPGRTLSCVSCHHPHASDRERLFQGAQTSAAGVCLLCHRKMSVLP